jgi:hypothetical protein
MQHWRKCNRTSQQHGKGKRYDTADLDDDETVNLIERTLFVSTKARLDRAFLLRAAHWQVCWNREKRGTESRRNHHVECSLT